MKPDRRTFLKNSVIGTAGLISRIHEMVKSIGLQRKKPILVAIRVPDSVEYCKAIGIDLVQWLEYKDQTTYVNENSWSKPETWIKDGYLYVSKEIKKYI